ncbi:MAG: class II aldolase/adducin family protein [Treponema sp.]
MSYNSSNSLEKKQLIIRAGNLLAKNGLVERTWGNVSARLDDEYFAISPTGASYASITPEDIPIVNFKNHSHTGNKKPSSELLLHAIIYNTYTKVSFILHTHQKFASLLSLFFTMKEGKIQIIGKHEYLEDAIPCAEYAEAGTAKLAENVIKAIGTLPKAYRDHGIALMAAHGVLCFASNFDEAFNMIQVLEDFAKEMVFNTLTKQGITFDFSGKLQTYTKATFLTESNNSIIKEMCSIIFKELPSTAFITLSTLPISQYISQNLDVLPYMQEFSIKGIPAYFDDYAQIIGDCALIAIDKQKIILSRSNALIIEGIGVLCFSEQKDETMYMASIFEKNALAFLLSLNNKNIIPLEKENAISLHQSFIKGYSKLKNN